MTFPEARALAAALVPPEHVDCVSWELMRVYHLGHTAGREEILWRTDLVYRAPGLRVREQEEETS